MAGNIADGVDVGVAVGGVRAGSEGEPHGHAGDFRRLPLAVAGAQALTQQWQRALACEPGVRAGDDPAAVHKLRVALRRFRAAARVFGKAIDRAAGQPVAAAWAADAAAVASPLGRVRDLDVFIAYLQREADTAPACETVAIQRLVARRRAERALVHRAALAALDGPAAQRPRETVAQVLAPLAAGACRTKGKRRTVGRCAPKLVARRLRRLRRRIETLIVPRPEDLHRVRIGAKHLRYTAEFFTTGFAAALPPIVDLATQIQDALGEAHDLDVLSATLLNDVERVAQDPAQAAEAAIIARLIRRWQERREAALERFRTLWVTLPQPDELRQEMAQRRPARDQTGDDV